MTPILQAIMDYLRNERWPVQPCSDFIAGQNTALAVNYKPLRIYYLAYIHDRTDSVVVHIPTTGLIHRINYTDPSLLDTVLKIIGSNNT